MSERQKLYTRRDFLRSLVVTGIATGVMYAVPESVLHAIPAEKHEDFVERNGVFVRGEGVEFRSEVGGELVRASVNETAFVTGLKAIAEEMGTQRHLQHFLSENPLKISLNDGGVWADAQYLDSHRFEEPELEISTSYLRRYHSALQSEEDKKVLEVDGLVAHELRHVWQDSLGLMREVRAAYVPIVTIPYTVTHAVGENMGMDSKFRLVLNGLGLMFGYQLSSLLNPAEIDAYFKENEIVEYPEFKKLRGQFFNFDKVS